jgi:Ankyrin repeat
VFSTAHVNRIADVSTAMPHCCQQLVMWLQDGMTALMMASKNGRKGVVRQLLATPGINVNVVDAKPGFFSVTALKDDWSPPSVGAWKVLGY